MQTARYPAESQASGWYHLLDSVPALAPLQEQRHVDFLIIGAGFAGLSAAKRLSDLDPNASIAILEAQRLAGGASGRNSGFMIDLPHELNSKSYHGGVDADIQQIQQNRLAIAFAANVVDEFALKDCFQRCGKHHGATNGSGLRALDDFCQQLDTLNEPFEQLNQAQMKSLTGSDYYDGGIFTPGAVQIQPAAYIRGLGHALTQQRNVTIYENSPVIKLEAGHAPSAWTKSGHITASKILLCNNGHITSFGIAKNKILNLFTYASLTEPLTAEQLKHTGELSAWGLIPAAPMGSTLRKLNNGRLLIRNEWTYNPSIEVNSKAWPRIAQQHDQCFKRRYPNLANVKMQYRWHGPVALTLNGASLFGEVEQNIHAAAVCQGLGTTRSTLYGMVLADALCHQENPLIASFSDQPTATQLPPQTLNKLGVPLYLKWLQWRAGKDL
jgi:glycine/D-amino acid oxidase-like deaminating enzyme